MKKRYIVIMVLIFLLTTAQLVSAQVFQMPDDGRVNGIPADAISPLFRETLTEGLQAGRIPTLNGSYYYRDRYELMSNIADRSARIFPLFDPEATTFALMAEITIENGDPGASLEESGCGFIFRNNDPALHPTDPDSYMHALITMAGNQIFAGMNYNNPVAYETKKFAEANPNRQTHIVAVFANGSDSSVLINRQEVRRHFDLPVLTPGQFQYTIQSGSSTGFGTRCLFERVYLFIPAAGGRQGKNDQSDIPDQQPPQKDDQAIDESLDDLCKPTGIGLVPEIEEFCQWPLVELPVCVSGTHHGLHCPKFYEFAMMIRELSGELCADGAFKPENMLQICNYARYQASVLENAGIVFMTPSDCGNQEIIPFQSCMDMIGLLNRCRNVPKTGAGEKCDFVAIHSVVYRDHPLWDQIARQCSACEALAKLGNCKFSSNPSCRYLEERCKQNADYLLCNNLPNLKTDPNYASLAPGLINGLEAYCKKAELAELECVTIEEPPIIRIQPLPPASNPANPPAVQGCPQGQVYNPATGVCSWPGAGPTGEIPIVDDWDPGFTHGGSAVPGQGYTPFPWPDWLSP